MREWQPCVGGPNATLDALKGNYIENQYLMRWYYYMGRATSRSQDHGWVKSSALIEARATSRVQSLGSYDSFQGRLATQSQSVIELDKPDTGCNNNNINYQLPSIRRAVAQLFLIF